MITGTQIFGKALLEAGRQAAKSLSPCDTANVLLYFCVDAKHRPQGAVGFDVAGVGNATTGSLTDKLTREHRMTLDEAHLILNAKRGDGIEQILEVCPFQFGVGSIRKLKPKFTCPCPRRLELRTPVQGEHATGGAANAKRCTWCTGDANASALALLAVKGGTGA